MTGKVPIKSVPGVELVPIDDSGICKILVQDPEKRFDLSWDRFVRLNAAAEAIAKTASKDAKILDVGGFDGALALFLSEYHIDLIDPATTGSSLTKQSGNALSYDLVAAIDTLEHIAPEERENALRELSVIASKWIILNYPCTETKAAQKLMLRATNNQLIREHAEWDLPNSDWVLSTMQEFGFTGTVTPHSSLAVWLGQYLSLNLAPETAADLNRYLIQNHHHEPFSTPLYHLVVLSRVATKSSN